VKILLPFIFVRSHQLCTGMDRGSEGSLNSETSDIGERGVRLIIFYEAETVPLIITCERRIASTPE
jgi:hypothetical protein